MNNSEWIYELNLPPVSEVLLESFTGFETTFNELEFNYQYRMDIEDIFKPEWLTFKDFKWDRLLYFMKNNFEGKIHTDIPVVFWDTEYESCTPWGISWVWDGPGIQEYWNFEDVTRDYVTEGAHNVTKGKVWTYTQKTSATKTYHLEPDKVYLVNGRMPHRATGFNGRKVISYRTLELKMMPSWDQVVDRFRDIII